MEYAKYKHITVNLSLYEKLRAIGPEESFNSVISRLVDQVEQETSDKG
jgi:predicted CopG family antitoxin